MKLKLPLKPGPIHTVVVRNGFNPFRKFGFILFTHF